MNTSAKWRRVELPRKRSVFAVMLVGGAVGLDMISGELGIKDFALAQTFHVGDVVQVIQLGCGALFAWLAKEECSEGDTSGAADKESGDE